MNSRIEMDWLLGGLRKGELWREGRKILDRSLRPGATLLYHQMIQENVRGYLARLLATPKEFRTHISLSVDVLPPIMPPLLITICSLQGKLAMSLTYGYDPKEGDDMMAAPIRATEMITRLLLPGAALVNEFPFRAVMYCIIVISSKLTFISSEVYSLMGTMAQLRIVGARGQEAE
jgi:hypothetical protein